MLQGEAPDLLIHDPIARLFSGNVNDREQVEKLLHYLNQLADRYNMAILLLGHPSKAADSRYSGTTAWSGHVRSHLWLSTNKETALHGSNRTKDSTASLSTRFGSCEQMRLPFIR